MVLGAFGYGFLGTGSYPRMTEERHRFHRLFRAAALSVGLCLSWNPEPATGQRVWGNAETLILGPSAVVPLHSHSSPDPLNPAASSRIRTGAEVSLAIPLGLRELAVQRFAGRAALGATSLSVMVGRLGFDQLEQHRISVSAARSVSGVPGRPFFVGVRGRLDGFSSPERALALEPALSLGGLLRLSDAVETGLVTTVQDADVHGSRAIDIRGALAMRFSRHVRAGLGWKQSTALGSEMSTALILESEWGGSLTAGTGNRMRNAGISCALQTGGVRVVMAWVKMGPAGASRFVSAGLFRTAAEYGLSD